MKKRLLALPVALLILAVTAFSAFADESDPTTATITITGSPFYVLTNPIPLEPVDLDGKATTVENSATVTWTAVDPRGTGEGWHLTIDSTDFTNENGKTIDISEGISEFKIQVLDDDIFLVDGNVKPVQVSAGMQPIATTGTGTTRFVSAAVDTGMGTYNITPSFELEVPAQVYAGEYTATVTVTIVSGPGS